MNNVNNEALIALTELVRLKRIKDTPEWVDDYFRNKDKAWEAAFKVVDTAQKSTKVRVPQADISEIDFSNADISPEVKKYVDDFLADKNNGWNYEYNFLFNLSQKLPISMEDIDDLLTEINYTHPSAKPSDQDLLWAKTKIDEWESKQENPNNGIQ